MTGHFLHLQNVIYGAEGGDNESASIYVVGSTTKWSKRQGWKKSELEQVLMKEQLALGKASFLVYAIHLQS